MEKADDTSLLIMEAILKLQEISYSMPRALAEEKRKEAIAVLKRALGLGDK